MAQTEADMASEESPLIEAGAKQPSYARNWFAFFLLGTINNLSFVVINSASKTIAHKFHSDNSIGLIPWALVAFGFAARAVNVFLLNTSYSMRVIVNSALMVVGLIGVALSKTFIEAVVAIIVAGFASSFGECLILGYLNKFPPTLVNAWSSGTGMAGVAGSALYLLYVGVDLTLEQSFFATLPWIGVYLLAFFVILDRSGIKSNPRTAGNVQATSEEDGVVAPTESKMARFKRLFKLVWYLALQLFLVYIFEYIISGGAAAKVLKPHEACIYENEDQCSAVETCRWKKDNCEAKKFLYRGTFEILAFCYQIGVFISRSSLEIVKIERVGLITLLQGLNLVFWIAQDILKFLSPYPLFALMVFVGLLGGASYVNVFYLLLQSERIPRKDRELSVNIVAFAITGGITVGSACILLFDKTFLKDY